MTHFRDLAKQGFRVLVAACGVLGLWTLGYPPLTAAVEPEPSIGSKAAASSLSPNGKDGEVESGAKPSFGPVIHEISTSAPGGSTDGSVELVMSSEVDAVGRDSSRRFIYTYVFQNTGGTTIKVTLVGPHLALSPLFELMRDFSLVLSAGEVKTFQFATASQPELSPATAYNVSQDEQKGEWNFVSSGAVSLYLPTSLKAAYTFD